MEPVPASSERTEETVERRKDLVRLGGEVCVRGARSDQRRPGGDQCEDGDREDPVCVQRDF